MKRVWGFHREVSENSLRLIFPFTAVYSVVKKKLVAFSENDEFFVLGLVLLRC